MLLFSYFFKILLIIFQGLFRATIEENLACTSNQPISTEEIRSLMIKLGLHEYVLSLSEGYLTVPKEMHESINLKFSLARALLKKPKILLIDEVDKYLDTTGCSLFFSAIQDYVRQSNCSVLLIANNQAMLEQCNDIYIIEKGKTVKSSKEDLVKVATRYNSM